MEGVTSAADARWTGRRPSPSRSPGRRAATGRQVTGHRVVIGNGQQADALLLGTLLSRGLSRPIRELVSATGRVAEGDFETEVSVRTHDEVGTLAEAFNDMTRGLLL